MGASWEHRLQLGANAANRFVVDGDRAGGVEDPSRTASGGVVRTDMDRNVARCCELPRFTEPAA